MISIGAYRTQLFGITPHKSPDPERGGKWRLVSRLLVLPQNALLGETPAELAALISLAARDPALRRRLGKAARQTYERAYTPLAVGKRLMSLGTTARRKTF